MNNFVLETVLSVINLGIQKRTPAISVEMPTIEGLEAEVAKIDNVAPAPETVVEVSQRTPVTSEQSTAIATGCVPCSIGHLGTCSGLLNEAMRFARSDGIESEEVISRCNMCLDELNALERVDLRPELIHGLPDWEKALAEKALTLSRSLRHDLEGLSNIDALEAITAKTQGTRQEIGSAWFKERLSRISPEQRQMVEDKLKQKFTLDEAKKVAAEEAAKEPWEMTQEEWLVDVGYKKSQGSRVRENWLGTHEGEVRVAIQNRKPVPPEVLKDYPDLAKQAKPVSPYKTPPGRHEVPQFGEAGAVPEYTPSAEGRRRVIESRLKRGETVPAKLLAEFPDLAKEYGIAIPQAKAVETIPKAEPSEVTPAPEATSVKRLIGERDTLEQFMRQHKQEISDIDYKSFEKRLSDMDLAIARSGLPWGLAIPKAQAGMPEVTKPITSDQEQELRGLRVIIANIQAQPELRKSAGVRQQLEAALAREAELTGVQRQTSPQAKTEREARYGFLQLNEAEYQEAQKSGRYPEPTRYEQLTAYFTEPHEANWKGLSLAEMFPTKYKDLLQRGVPDNLSPLEVQQVIEEKRIPYDRGLNESARRGISN